MVRPLGLPVGSVRAILLMALAATSILELRATKTLPPWLVVALTLAAASYFAARGATRDGEKPRRGPLGLPRGTIRFLFVVLAAYGAWLWFRYRDVEVGSAPVVWVLLAYAVGLLVHAIVSRARSRPDLGANAADHVLSLVTLLSAGGLVWLAAEPAATPPAWVEPLLGAVVVHYFAAR